MNSRYRALAAACFLSLVLGCHAAPAPSEGIGDGTGRDLDLLAATKTLQQTLATNPNDEATEFALANVLARRGIYEDAILHYKRVVTVDPEHGAGWHNLALAYERQGLMRDALNAAETASTLQPDNKLFVADSERLRIKLREGASGETAFRMMLSDFYATLAKGDGAADLAAAKVAATLLTTWPDQAHAWNAAGIMASRQDEPTLAAERFEKAIELDPKDLQSRYNRAILAWSNKDSETAEYQLGILANLLKDDARALAYVTKLRADLAVGKTVTEARIAASERPVSMAAGTL
ncbi:MAG: tetratricopeptide repeat protein [bacterium]